VNGASDVANGATNAAGDVTSGATDAVTGPGAGSG